MATITHRPVATARFATTDPTTPPWRPATAAVLAMLGWFALTNLVSLYPLNDLASQGSPWASTLAGFVPFTLTLSVVAAVALTRLAWRTWTGSTTGVRQPDSTTEGGR